MGEGQQQKLNNLRDSRPFINALRLKLIKHPYICEFDSEDINLLYDASYCTDPYVIGEQALENAENLLFRCRRNHLELYNSSMSQEAYYSGKTENTADYNYSHFDNNIPVHGAYFGRGMVINPKYEPPGTIPQNIEGYKNDSTYSDQQYEDNVYFQQDQDDNYDNNIAASCEDNLNDSRIQDSKIKKKSKSKATLSSKKSQDQDQDKVFKIPKKNIKQSELLQSLRGDPGKIYIVSTKGYAETLTNNETDEYLKDQTDLDIVTDNSSDKNNKKKTKSTNSKRSQQVPAKRNNKSQKQPALMPKNRDDNTRKSLPDKNYNNNNKSKNNLTGNNPYNRGLGLNNKNVPKSRQEAHTSRIFPKSKTNTQPQVKITQKASPPAPQAKIGQKIDKRISFSSSKGPRTLLQRPPVNKNKDANKVHQKSKESDVVWIDTAENLNSSKSPKNKDHYRTKRVNKAKQILNQSSDFEDILSAFNTSTSSTPEVNNNKRKGDGLINSNIEEAKRQRLNLVKKKIKNSGNRRVTRSMRQQKENDRIMQIQKEKSKEAYKRIIPKSTTVNNALEKIKIEVKQEPQSNEEYFNEEFIENDDDNQSDNDNNNLFNRNSNIPVEHIQVEVEPLIDNMDNFSENSEEQLEKEDEPFEDTNIYLNEMQIDEPKNTNIYLDEIQILDEPLVKLEPMDDEEDFVYNSEF